MKFTHFSLITLLLLSLVLFHGAGCHTSTLNGFWKYVTGREYKTSIKTSSTFSIFFDNYKDAFVECTGNAIGIRQRSHEPEFYSRFVSVKRFWLCRIQKECGDSASTSGPQGHGSVKDLVDDLVHKVLSIRQLIANSTSTNSTSTSTRVTFSKNLTLTP
jgi:hypothetical protein